jgi:hypothetical protein
MSFAFNKKLAGIQARLKNWWEFGDQDTPCIIIRAMKENHDPISDADDLKKFWTDVDFVVARQMAVIDNSNYYGQAVPYHYVDMGSSAMVGVLGSPMEYVDKGTIWANPSLTRIEDVFDVTLDQNNFYYRTIRQIAQRSAQIARNHHYIAPFALEGLTDILAGLYGTENFLIDLIQNPGKVKQAARHIARLWIEAFEDFQRLITPAGNPGGIGWAGVWAPGSTFPIQEDASYMISPAMFMEFCLPFVAEIIEVLDYPFYHLDGIGAIPHLDSLLQLQKLKAIQWQPGAGKEKLAQWYDLIRKILDHRKSVQLYASPDEVDGLVKNVGPRGLLVICESASNEQAEILMDHYSTD